MEDAGYTYIWIFDVAEGAEAEFERAYGPDGEWVRLFRRSRGYRGSVLLRDLDEPRRYVTMDRWASAAAFERFRAEHAAPFEALDRRCQALTVAETRLGRYAPAEPGTRG